MKVVLIGASPLAVFTAELLLRRGDEVVIIESDHDKVHALSEHLDCGLVHGDGTRPAVLREVGPEATAFLFCLMSHDRDNILAALVGRSLGFKRVVLKIEDPEIGHICTELGLTDTIVPDQSVARALADMTTGHAGIDLSTMIRGPVRFYAFVVRDEDAGEIAALGLPKRTRAVCVYRGDEVVLPEAKTEVRKGDEVVLITHSEDLPALTERWGEG